MVLPLLFPLASVTFIFAAAIAILAAKMGREPLALYVSISSMLLLGILAVLIMAA
jgi:hypothetical protein